MKNLLLAVACLLSSVFCLVSCTKEGTGGKASIKGMVMHHDKMIPGATVYIKYGVKESPGSNVQYYDDHVAADGSGNYQFVDLKKGNYYLFAVGFDSSITQTVTGGIPAVIKRKTETVGIKDRKSVV